MSTQNESNWYEFTAYNTGAIYGFGTEADAEKYCEHLNKDREINVFSYAIAEGENADYCDDWNNLEDELICAEEQEWESHKAAIEERKELLIAVYGSLEAAQADGEEL